MEEKIIGFELNADVYTSSLYSIPWSRKLNAKDMIKDINSILFEIQEEIDYEKDRCKCCGIHPDELY